MNIKQALAALAPANDDHWTADGLPRVEAVTDVIGHEVSRREITDTAPSFVRPEASGMPPEEGEPAPAEPETPAEDPPAEAPKPDPAAAPAEGAPDDAEDPAQAAYVEPLDPVVTMDVRTVAADIDLVQRAIEEFGRQASILTSRAEAIDKQLRAIGQRSAGLQKILDRLGKSQTSQQRDAIQRYLKGQQEARAQRALRAQRFIAAGTTAQDVKDQLDGPSKIDSAMKQRKPGRGAGRPVYPQAVGAR